MRKGMLEPYHVYEAASSLACRVIALGVTAWLVEDAMQKLVSACLAVLLSVACGDDDGAHRKPARDRDVIVDSGERNLHDASKPVDAGSPEIELPSKTVRIWFKPVVNGEPFDCARTYVL